MTKDPIFTNLITENNHRTRQPIIKAVEEEIGGKLIYYIENPDRPFAYIDSHEVIQFKDLLHLQVIQKRDL